MSHIQQQNVYTSQSKQMCRCIFNVNCQNGTKNNALTVVEASTKIAFRICNVKNIKCVEH